ncbi:MAG: methyltransferase [Pseudomonadota bacterium]
MAEALEPAAQRARMIVTRLGSAGEGLARPLCDAAPSSDARGESTANAADVYAPYTLPDEIITAHIEDGRATGIRIERASDARVRAPCPHFGRCGGCALQHAAAPLYEAFKRDRLAQAFAARGLAIDVEGPVRFAHAARRRATFTARRTKKGVMLGFHEARAETLVDLRTCKVLRPELEAQLPVLRKLIHPLLTRKGTARLAVTLARNGLDVAITGVARLNDPNLRQSLIDVAQRGQLVRLTIDDDIVLQQATPYVAFAGVDVEIPPGAFLQASEEADAALLALISEAVGPAREVIDLFCGLGTFALGLARSARVRAYDGDRAAVSALQQAHRQGRRLKPIEAVTRDLYADPLNVKELDAAEVVIFDPPRAGAKAQAQVLAQSKVPVVVAVSCNPATLARDARTLIDGGYRLTRLTAVDQFAWSAHVEAVAVFKR